MNFLRIVFTISVVAVFAFAIPSAHALTNAEIQALITQLQEQIAQLQKQLAETEPQAWCHTFNTNIRFGDSNDEVFALQTALDKEGFSVTTGGENGPGQSKFGEYTASAVVGFQEKYKSEVLAPFRLARGTGFIGTSTRAKLNALYGCGVVQLSTPAPVPAPTPTPIPTPTIPIPQPISPSITVLSPNGGEKFVTGDIYNITWNARGVGSVTLWLADFGVSSPTWYRISPDLSNLAIGKYSWKVGTCYGSICNFSAGDKYKVKVSESASSFSYPLLAEDESDSYFSIVSATPSITVISPNGGEQLQKGSTQIIKWNSSNVSQVYIKLRKGSDTYHGTEGAVSSVISNTGFYQWTIPTTLPDGSDYAIRVVDSGGAVSDDGDNYFSIASALPDLALLGGFTITPASPVLGQDVLVAFTMVNQGNAVASSAVVSSYVIQSDGSSLIHPSNTCTGSTVLQPGGSCVYAYTFKFPTSGVKQIEVKLDPYNLIQESNENNNVLSPSLIVSPVPTPSITVLSPNGGEFLAPGVSTVTWKSANIPAGQPINIIGLVGMDGTEYHLKYDTSNDGSEQVTLPTFDKSGSFKVKVETTVNKQAVTDLSDNYFNLIPSSQPSITSFNYTDTDAYNGSVKFSWINGGTDSVNLWIPCYSGLTMKNAVTGANFLCGESDLNLPSNSSLYLKFTNTSGASVNATATLTPIAGNITYGVYSKTLNFSIVSGGVGLQDAENQLADILSAVLKLLEQVKALPR